MSRPGRTTSFKSDVCDAPSAAFEELLHQVRRQHVDELRKVRRSYEVQLSKAREKFTELIEAQDEEESEGTEQKRRLSILSAKSSFSSLSGLGEDLQAIHVEVDGEAFKLKEGWKRTLALSEGGYISEAHLLANKASNENGAPRTSKRSLDPREVMPKRSRCIILPSSTFRLCWDCIGLFLIGYDLLTIPFNLAFVPTPNLMSKSIDWLTLLFWTSDMMQGFCLGYYDQGEIVVDQWMVFKNYIKSWLSIDILVVVPEWFVIFVPSTGGETDEATVGDLGKIAKFARVMRVLRLLRLLKMKKFLETLVDRIESEYSFILFNLIHLSCFVLVLNHVIACVWYMISRVTKGEPNWVSAGNVNGTIAYLYATSLHWSLTQFTPASMDISARNLIERLFSILVLFFAMLVFSSIVASITQSMTALRNLQGNEMRQFWLLRRYLRQRHIQQSLSERIIKFLEHRSHVQGKLVQRDRVPVLGNLSEALHAELMHEMYSSDLDVHPFFSRMKDVWPGVMHRLVRAGLRLQNYACNESVFGAGDEAKFLYFAKSGDFHYIVEKEGEKHTHTCEKIWLSEAVFFTDWRHRGQLLSISDQEEAEVITLDPGQFMAVMSMHPWPWREAVVYGRKFVELLNENQKDFTDMPRDDDFYQELIAEVESMKSLVEKDSQPDVTEGEDGDEEDQARRLPVKDVDDVAVGVVLPLCDGEANDHLLNNSRHNGFVPEPSPATVGKQDEDVTARLRTDDLSSPAVARPHTSSARSPTCAVIASCLNLPSVTGRR